MMFSQTGLPLQTMRLSQRGCLLQTMTDLLQMGLLPQTMSPSSLTDSSLRMLESPHRQDSPLRP